MPVDGGARHPEEVRDLLDGFLGQCDLSRALSDMLGPASAALRLLDRDRDARRLAHAAVVAPDLT